MMDYNKFVGIPFINLGRDKYGADCWGLVRIIYKEIYNVELPSLSVYDNALEHKDIAQTIAISTPLISNEELDEPEEGCIVLMASQGFSGHVGVFIGDGMIIHTTKQTGAVIEPLYGKRLKNKIKGYYRVNKSYYTNQSV